MKIEDGDCGEVVLKLPFHRMADSDRKDRDFKNVFQKNARDDVERAREAVMRYSGLCCLVKEAGSRGEMLAGTLVYHPHNDHLFTIDLLSCRSQSIKYEDLIELYI